MLYHFYFSAFLRNKRESVNVITVDYASVSRCPFDAVRSYQPVIGKQVGRLLKSLMNYGAVPLKFHLLGLGMGSHIAGFAAREIHPKKVGRLTGQHYFLLFFRNYCENCICLHKITFSTALDPTFLGYLNHKPQLHSNDSDYMDVIHTAQRKISLVKHLGNARFFPNDGTRQPLAAGKSQTRKLSSLPELQNFSIILNSIIMIFRGQCTQPHRFRFLLHTIYHRYYLHERQIMRQLLELCEGQMP